MKLKLLHLQAFIFITIGIVSKKVQSATYNSFKFVKIKIQINKTLLRESFLSKFRQTTISRSSRSGEGGRVGITQTRVARLRA